jgi:hypothetical protein
MIDIGKISANKKRPWNAKAVFVDGKPLFYRVGNSEGIRRRGRKNQTIGHSSP